MTKAQPHGVGARGREGRTPKGQGGHTQLKAPHPVQGGAVPGRGARGGGGREGTSKRIKETRPGLSRDQKKSGVLSRR